MSAPFLLGIEFRVQSFVIFPYFISFKMLQIIQTGQMASVAEKTAAAYLQKLYNNTEEDKLRDFELISRDGDKFRVHSLFLQLR